MIPVTVIADDLTGAADTGVQFSRAFSPVYLLGSHALQNVRFLRIPGVLSIYTNSRHLPASRADQSVRDAMSYLNMSRPQTIYKKIDSCLRGNLGIEIDAVMDARDCQTSFVAPAFPSQGRTTIHGVHYLHGIPLSETQVATDPSSPVRESHLPTLLSGQSPFKIGHVDIDILDSSDHQIRVEVERCMKDNCRHIVFDAGTQQHLNKIAQLARKYFPQTLLAGSAGLAAGMAADLGHADEQLPPTSLSVTGNLLWVCGSTSEVLAGQVQQLVEKVGVPKVELPPGIIADARRSSVWQKLATQAERILDRNSLIVQIGHDSDQNPAPPGHVLAGLSRLIGSLVNQCQPAGLFLSGGDTADTILQTVGTQFINLEREVLPGLPGGILSGGLMDGRPVITKAGAFGKPDDLVKLHRRLRRIERTLG